VSTEQAASSIRWTQDDGATVVLDIAPTEVVTAISRLWSRIARGVADIPAGDWERPTRCSEWTVVDIVNHLADVNAMAAEVAIASMEGRRSHVFDGFDPRSAPMVRTAAADRDPAVAQGRLLGAVETMLAGLDFLDVASLTPLTETPIGAQPLAVAVLHLLWDAWLHERDLFIPLGVAVPELADEVRLAALYSLRMLGCFQAMLGREVHVPLTLSGVLDTTLVLDVRAGSTSVREASTANEPEPHLRADAATAVDALCGRGEIEAALDGPDELRRRVTTLRKVLAGA
jgi:uncharacterized protein (TIGR03083 family)